MALLKTNKHLRNRRTVDRGTPPIPRSATVTPTVSTTTVTLTFNAPMVWNGEIPGFTVAGSVINSVNPVSQTVFQLLLDASGAGDAWVYPANDPTFKTNSGGYVAAAAGTFP